jgi:hypothetical protein
MPSEDERESPDKRRKRLCDEFGKALKAGPRPSIEDYLTRVPDSEKPELLEELVREEHLFRRKAGELPSTGAASLGRTRPSSVHSTPYLAILASGTPSSRSSARAALGRCFGRRIRRWGARWP